MLGVRLLVPATTSSQSSGNFYFMAQIRKELLFGEPNAKKEIPYIAYIGKEGNVVIRDSDENETPIIIPKDDWAALKKFIDAELKYWNNG